MPFYNGKSIIIEDRRGKLYTFFFQDHKLTYSLYHRDLGKVEKKLIVEDATNDFDGSINYQGEIYLVCKDQKNNIILLSNHRDFSYGKYILDHHKGIQDIMIRQMDHQIHILYHRKDEDTLGGYTIHHYKDDGMSQQNSEICRVNSRDILNPMCCLVEKEGLLLTYFDLISDTEQIFLRSYSKSDESWSEPIQLTDSREVKLYHDVLLDDQNLHLTYCEYTNGNLVVKYEKHICKNGSNRKIYEYTISNQGNCSHPILIIHDGLLWLCWTEYSYIASRFSTDQGRTWSELYLWDESRKEDIILFKYTSNKDSPARLNHSFGKAKELGFIGFGKLDQVSVIPLKEGGNHSMAGKDVLFNGMERDTEKNKPSNSIKTIEKGARSVDDIISEIREEYLEKTKDIQGELMKIDGRLTIIEEFLLRYTKRFKDYIE